MKELQLQCLQPRGWPPGRQFAGPNQEVCSAGFAYAVGWAPFEPSATRKYTGLDSGKNLLYQEIAYRTLSIVPRGIRELEIQPFKHKAVGV